MRFKPIELTLVGIFVAIAIVSVYATFLLPGIMLFGVDVPLSFLPFISVLTGALLGKKLGAITMLIYMLLGLIGLPVFADGVGGIGYIFKPTFGFVLGFICSAWVSGWIVERWRTRMAFTVATTISLIPQYVIGTLYLWGILILYLHTEANLWGLTLGMLPFFIKDFVVAIIGSVVIYQIALRLSKGRNLHFMR